MTSGVKGTALVVLVVAGLSGCGGQGGDPSAFGRATDKACKSLSTAVGTLRQDLVRTSASSEGAGLATALQRYSGSVRRTADELARTNPPRADAAFRSAAVSGLRRHADAMHDAAVAGRRGRDAPDLTRQLRGKALPEIPDAVLRDAPSCRDGAG